MKKILTVSLMAMMVVGAARADIASVGYVDEKLATKANASDVTSINNKLGTVEEGKTLAGMIAEAKTEATYDDTEVRGFIDDNADAISANAEAISALETKVGDSSVADQIDAVRATTIAGLSEEEKAAMLPTVALTEEMIATSALDLGGLVNANATAITIINEGAVMNSGITADKVTAYDAYAEEISDNATAAANAQAAAEAAQGAAEAAQGAADAAQGAAAQALTDAKSYADGVAATAKSEAITAAKTAGDAAYDAKGAAEAAKTAAVTAAKQAADAAYAAKSYEGRVQANETAIAANTAAAAAAKSAADEAQADADAAQDAADANTQAIEKINIASAQLLTQGAGDGQYALTMTKSGDSLVYKWEMIGR